MSNSTPFLLMNRSADTIRILQSLSDSEFESLYSLFFSEKTRRLKYRKFPEITEHEKVLYKTNTLKAYKAYSDRCKVSLTEAKAAFQQLVL